jgi:hypothetical protein
VKILIKTIAGSHLFGTATENSDHDYKGVFLPDADDILLGKFDQTIHQKTNKVEGKKNNKDDIDVELYSLDKFLKMLYQGQTVAWELLFTPDEFIIEKHPVWDEIRVETPKFLNKKVDAFIGYCKQQAHKYGVRGSRMNTMDKVLELLEQHDEYSCFEDIEDDVNQFLLKLEHVEIIPDKYGKKLIHICGKKFSFDTELRYIIPPLQKYYDEYGERSRKAKENEGIDWKALSHAVRVCMQASSLLIYHRIHLPMEEANINLLKDIKAGKMDFETVAGLIESYQDMLLIDRENSTLPEQPNLAEFQRIQKYIYKMWIKDEL